MGDELTFAEGEYPVNRVNRVSITSGKVVEENFYDILMSGSLLINAGRNTGKNVQEYVRRCRKSISAGLLLSCYTPNRMTGFTGRARTGKEFHP